MQILSGSEAIQLRQWMMASRACADQTWDAPGMGCPPGRAREAGAECLRRRCELYGRPVVISPCSPDAGGCATSSVTMTFLKRCYAPMH